MGIFRRKPKTPCTCWTDEIVFCQTHDAELIGPEQPTEVEAALANIDEVLSRGALGILWGFWPTHMKDDQDYSHELG